MANFKLESGLRIRVTILDRRRRQRVKAKKQWIRPTVAHDTSITFSVVAKGVQV